MSDNVVEPKEMSQDGEKVDIKQSETLGNAGLLHDAFASENSEHEMSVLAAVRKHPWACLWAFIMCFTIVCFLFPHIL